jgi:hypothetical protein
MLRRSFYASLVVMLAVATATCGLPRSTVKVAGPPVQPGDQWYDALARAKAENKYILALVCDRANVGCQQTEQEMLKYDSGADVLRHEFAIVRIPEEGVTSRDTPSSHGTGRRCRRAGSTRGISFRRCCSLRRLVA